MADGDRRSARQSLRASLASLLDAVGAVDAALVVRRIVRLPFLPILTYHRIRASRAPDGFDDDVVDGTSVGFERHVRMLSRSFHLIGTRELYTYVRGEQELPANPAMITFDDGYRECRDIVLPILLRYGARATFFIATSFVEERRIFWWDAMSYIVKSTRRRELVVDYPASRAYPVDQGDPRRAIEQILRVVKDCKGLDVPRFVDAVARAADVPWSAGIERGLASSLVLTWDDVRALRDAGMDIQSHTRTHRILQMVPPEELDAELSGSRADLEAAIDKPVQAIAYPVGGAIEGDVVVCAAMAKAGYRLGFTNGSGTNVLAASMRPFGLRRVAAPGGLPDSYFRAAMAFPSLAHTRAAVVRVTER